MKNKILTGLAVFVLVAVLAHADETVENSTGPVSSGQQLRGFNLNGYNNQGEKTWDVNGTKADITEQNIQITNVDANFYGKQDANLTADHGTINKTSGNVHLQDNVVVTSNNRGTKMTTNTLDWDRNKDLVSTKDNVKIVDDQGVVTGKGMVAHPNLKKTKIEKDVKATVHSQGDGEADDQTVTITSDGPMQMNQATMYAVFNDHVVSVDPATGRELHCDKMEIWFDQSNKKIKKAICSGHAKAIQGLSVSFADKMIYEGSTEVLTMIGRPKIIFDTAGAKMNNAFKKKDKNKNKDE